MSATKTAPIIEQYANSLRSSDLYHDFLANNYFDESYQPYEGFIYHLLASTADKDLLTHWTTEALTSPNPAYRECLAANPNTSVDVLIELFTTTCTDTVRYWLAKNPSTPASVLDDLFLYVKENPAPAEIVPSLAVALAGRNDLTLPKIVQLQGIEHWRLTQELEANPRVAELKARPSITAWFMTPLSPAYQPQGAGERNLTWIKNEGSWSLDIQVQTPRHGRWTVMLQDINWGLSSISEPQELPATNNSATVHGLSIADTDIENANLALLLGRICATGLITNHAGTVIGIEPQGIVLTASLGAYDLILHARTLTYRP